MSADEIELGRRIVASKKHVPQVEKDCETAEFDTDGDLPAPAAPPPDDTAANGSGSTGSAGSNVEGALNRTRDWLERFICPMDPRDLDLLTLWIAHTHLVDETYTTPRLLIESPVPESGKTTVLEHAERLSRDPLQMATLNSPAMLTRLLKKGMRTILIDEADRSLNPDKPGIDDLIAVLNSGYKKGATRPVLVPIKGGGWDVDEMPTYSPVAMAGNQPKLPDDTLSRTIRMLIMPDHEGTVEDSDWELIEPEAKALAEDLNAWADWGAQSGAERISPVATRGCQGPHEGTVDAAQAGRCRGRWPVARGRRRTRRTGPRTNTHREGGRNHEREATRHSAEARCRGLGKRSELPLHR